MFLLAVSALACGHNDRAVVPPAPAEGPPDVAGESADETGIFAEAPDCPDPAEAEVACLDDGVGSCCAVASIPHEYEMLEASSHGDDAAAEAHRAKMLQLLSKGCDEGDLRSCEWLDAATGD